MINRNRSIVLVVFVVLATLFGVARASQPVQPTSGIFTNEYNPFMGYNPDTGSARTIHLGDDMNKTDGNDVGEKVYAIKAGKVTYAGATSPTSSSGYRVHLAHTLPNGRIICSENLHLQDATNVYDGSDPATDPGGFQPIVVYLAYGQMLFQSCWFVYHTTTCLKLE